MIKKLVPNLLLCIMLAWFALPGALHAALEPNSVTILGMDTGSTPNKVPDADFEAVVEAPASGTAGYTIDSYVSTWNTSSVALDDTQLNSVTYTEKAPHSTNIVIPVDRDVFAGSDEVPWYLHVKTVYYETGNPEVKLSDDFIVQYTFDDVAPVGSIVLDETNENQTSSTSTSSKLILSVPENTADIVWVHVNTSDQYLSAESYDFSDPAITTLEYTVAGEGQYTLYAWFEDLAGNISSEAKTLSVEVIAGKSIDPVGDMNLEVGGTTTFQLTGAAEGETFDWEIVDATSGAASTAAEFVGNNSAVSTVTVKGVTEGGTVKVKATPTAGGNAYESGIITIIKTTTVREFTLIKNADNTSLNAISYPFAVSGMSKIADLYAAIENCDGIQWWDAATQSYKVYNQWAPNTNLDLVVGAVYFVSISAEQSAPTKFEGAETSVKFSLIKNEDNTSLNSISIPYTTDFSKIASVYDDINGCDGIQWWDAATQSYKVYNQWAPATNIDVKKGDSIFVSVTANVNWP